MAARYRHNRGPGVPRRGPCGGADAVLFLAPAAVAIHRFIIRGETMEGFALPVAGHTQAFLGWLVLIALVHLGLQTLTALASFSRPLLVATSLVVFAAEIAIVFLLTRLSLLFPAVAIDVPADSLTARARASWTLTRGRFWYILRATFAVSLLVGIPFAIVTVFLLPAMLPPADPGGHADIVKSMHLMADGPLMLVRAVEYTAITICDAAALSWLYRVLAEGEG